MSFAKRMHEGCGTEVRAKGNEGYSISFLVNFMSFLIRSPSHKSAVWQLRLANSYAIEIHSNLKGPAPDIVEHGKQHRWRVEVRITQEIDRAIHAYERNPFDISDRSIILDGLNYISGVLLHSRC